VSDPFDKPLFTEIALQGRVHSLELENEALKRDLRAVVQGLRSTTQLADEGWAYVAPWVQRKWKFRERIDAADQLVKDHQKWLAK
jgi:hypothetical protein